ncbi:hypothetical protein RN629_12035 [Sphingomonadaceae bacterium jetA1]|uniref:hypothetical protein n=1 Tax=Facivitalis istanbulensis TaxID=3075838 RepID=UPI00347509DE
MIVADAPATAGLAPPQLVVPDTVFVDNRIAVPEDPRLVWPRDTALTLEPADGELVVRFGQPPEPAAIERFRRAAGPAIGDLRWNDVSLVLRAAAGWTMDAHVVGAMLVVAFRPDTPPVRDRPVADATGARDMALAAVEADLAAGYPGRGRREAAALLARDPGDRRAARFLADARAMDGDTAGAGREYRAIGASDPAAARIIAAAGGRAAIGVTAREGGDLAQVEAAARVDAPVSGTVGLGAGLRHLTSRVDLAGGRRTRGTTMADAALAVALGDAARLQLLASAALDDGVTGGGAKMTYGPAEAQWRVTLTRHMPEYWTPAQVLAGGYLSRAALGGAPIA